MIASSKQQPTGRGSTAPLGKKAGAGLVSFSLRALPREERQLVDTTIAKGADHGAIF
jgi:hypothetical protein